MLARRASIILGILVAISAWIPSPAFGQSSRYFEDCTSSTFRIINGRKYLGNSIFKLKKLTVGQGVVDCMNLCSSYNNCWTFSYSKSKKLCFLSGTTPDGDELVTVRDGKWSSGYRQCSAADNSWTNDPIQLTASPRNDDDKNGSGNINSISPSPSPRLSPSPSPSPIPITSVVNATMCTNYGVANGYNGGCQWLNNNCCICPSCGNGCPFQNCANYGRR